MTAAVKLWRFGTWPGADPITRAVLVPVRPVMFDQDPVATIHHNSSPADLNATKANWLSYMPIGNGFVAIDNVQDHADSLPTAIDYKGHDAFSLAVFHQLHCLVSKSSRPDSCGSKCGLSRGLLE